VDIVDAVVRLCAMNLVLHGIGPTAADGVPSVEKADSLAAAPGAVRRDIRAPAAIYSVGRRRR
jgi:hypothetical protein